MARDLVYVNVNEEGETYQVNRDLESALDLLDDFPNDTVVIAWADSFTADRKGWK